MTVVQSRRRGLATVASLTAGVALFAALPGVAQASTHVPSRITVRPSDFTVQSGEQFVLRGRMTSRDNPVSGATVRVKTFRDGGWVRLPGAVVTTGSDGRYRVRVILSSGGDRDLRVVGDPRGDRIATAREETVVRVLR